MLTSSHKYLKILADSSSPLRVEGGVSAPLQPISELPSILEAVTNGKPVVVQVRSLLQAGFGYQGHVDQLAS